MKEDEVRQFCKENLAFGSKKVVSERWGVPSWRIAKVLNGSVSDLDILDKLYEKALEDREKALELSKNLQIASNGI